MNEAKLIPQLGVGDVIPLTNNQAPTTLAAEKPYGWILHPVIDIMFCCGGILWLGYLYCLTGARSTLENASGTVLWVAFGIGLLLFGVTHAPATWMRVYGSKCTSQKLSRLATIAGIVSVGLGVIGLQNVVLLIVMVKILQAWYFQHFYAQLYGITLIYCFKRNYRLHNWERQILSLMLQAAGWFIILRIFTFPEYGAFKLYEIQIPFVGPLPEWMLTTCQYALLALAVAFTGVVVRKYLVEKVLFPLPAMLCTVTGVVMFVLMQKNFDNALGVAVPYCFHNSQYLVVTAAFYLKERGLPEGVSVAQMSSVLFGREGLRYLKIVCLAGILVSIVLPQLLHFAGIRLGIASLFVYTVIQAHHYFTDGFIWRLKDPTVKKILLA